MTNRLSNTVSVIDTASLTEVHVIPLAVDPIAVAITPDGAFAYVSVLGVSTVAVIETVGNTVIANVSVGSRSGPVVLDVTPDSKHVYVANISSGTVVVIETASNTVVATVPVGGRGLAGLDITPNGALVYALHADLATVFVIETASNTVVDSLPLGLRPAVVAITPLIPVGMDIKPGSFPNCFNNDGHGVIPVAILSAAGFDATQVDPLTVSLDGQAVRVVGKKGTAQAHVEDVNGDARDDLVLQISDDDGTYEEGDTIATLDGKTFDRTPVRGTDSICIVPH